MSDETSGNEKLTIVHLKDKELVDRLCRQARQGTLAWLREKAVCIFWHNGDAEEMNYFSLGRFLGISRSEKLNLQSVVKVLVHESPFTFRNFEAHWSGGDGTNPTIRVRLTDTAEWKDVIDEAWEGLERMPHNLSDPAGRLLKWTQQEKHQKVWIDRLTVGRQAQLRGTSWTSEYIADLFKEIQNKSPINFQVEQKEDEFRVAFGRPKPEQAVAPCHGPLNPVLTVDFKKVEFAELERFRECLYDWILATNLPADGAELRIWHVDNRATLFRCFPTWTKEDWDISTIVDFLSEVALDHGLLWGYSFQDPEPWSYICVPKEGKTWLDVTSSIRKARTLPPLTKRYGISEEAAALMKWFTTLGPKEWLGTLTPELEENMEKRIGIVTDWDEENFTAYFSMLAEEITDRTEWKTTLVPWGQRWGRPQHRLLVRRKPTTFEDTVRQIQLLGISQGKLLPPDKVESTVRGLLETS